MVTYADIRRHQERDVRVRAGRIARRAALEVLSAAAALGQDAALARRRVQIIALHHVRPDEEPGFRALIERLQRQHTFLSYSDAVARVLSGEIDRPYVSVTFDDGLRNQLRAAAILDEYGISACFFVCDAMAEPRSDAEVREFCRRELWLPPMEFLSWDDMGALMKRGHEIGNHTSHHQTLALLDGPRLEDEISGSLERLRRRLGDVKHFAWPRGRSEHFSSAALAEVFRAGHVSCASAMRGCHLPGPAQSASDVVIRRDMIVAGEPLRHTMYFLARSCGR